MPKKVHNHIIFHLHYWLHKTFFVPTNVLHSEIQISKLTGDFIWLQIIIEMAVFFGIQDHLWWRFHKFSDKKRILIKITCIFRKTQNEKWYYSVFIISWVDTLLMYLFYWLNNLHTKIWVTKKLLESVSTCFRNINRLTLLNIATLITFVSNLRKIKSNLMKILSLIFCLFESILCKIEFGWVILSFAFKETKMDGNIVVN